jgi:SAM-dependent methyltransferase
MFKRVEGFHQERACAGMESARRYAEMAERLPVQYKGFLKELKALGIKSRYLEIGPGPGVLAAIIAQDNPDIQITGVELSPNMASVAREHVGRKGLGGRVQFVVGDAEDEDLINALGKFDLVYGTYTLHHWKDPKKVIRNLTSAVADGGVLYLYDLRRVWWLYWVPIHNGFWHSIRAAYVAREVRRMFQELGIDRCQIKRVFPFMQSIIVRK